MTSSEAELRAQIKNATDELTSTLESLANEAQPAVRIEHLKQDVKKAANSAIEDAKKYACEAFKRAKTTLQAAVSGDTEAIKKTAVVMGAAAATIVVLAIARR